MRWLRRVADHACVVARKRRSARIVLFALVGQCVFGDQTRAFHCLSACELAAPTREEAAKLAKLANAMNAADCAAIGPGSAGARLC